jgi:hypothetical protein
VGHEKMRVIWGLDLIHWSCYTETLRW